MMGNVCRGGIKRDDRMHVGLIHSSASCSVPAHQDWIKVGMTDVCRVLFISFSLQQLISHRRTLMSALLIKAVEARRGKVLITEPNPEKTSENDMKSNRFVI